MDIEALAKTNIDNFKLKWRWTDPDYLDMPEENLDKINALSPESASAVFDESSRLIKESNIENEGQRTSANNSEVAEYLARINVESMILVSWGPDCAVVTTTNIFIKYWEDFCYPTSDDVSIWPVNKAWLLQYFHYEEFSFVTL
ncbi:MAG: hypothetical protein AB2535_18740 [Candidatus Thiodiazotropha endolucinida]